MAEQFYTILTNTGKAKIANSLPTGTKVNLTTLKVGDSNGTYYNPSETQTDLVHTVYTCNVTSVAVDTTNGNWINITAVIPSDQGGFTIREVGVFDDSGNLIAIGKYPETYKPTASDGSTKELYLKMTLEVSNSSSVTLKIDPTVILATKSDINTLTTSMNNSISSITTQLSDMVTLKPNGTDDTEQITNIFTNAKDGQHIRFTKGTYILSGSNIIICRKSVKVEFEEGAIIDATNSTAPTIFEFTGSTDGYYQLGADASQWARVITVDSTLASTLSKGDIIYITTDTAYGGSGELWTSTRAYYFKGELAQVESISGNNITLVNPLWDSYTATNTTVSKVNTITVDINDFQLKANPTNGQVGLEIMWGKNCKVDSSKISGCSSKCLGFTNCFNYIASNNMMRDYFLTSLGLCYGICSGSSQNGIIENNDCSGGSHGITHGGTSPCRNIKVKNNTCFTLNAYTLVGIDAHENCEYFIIDGNICKGISISGRNHIIINNITNNQDASSGGAIACSLSKSTCDFIIIKNNSANCGVNTTNDGIIIQSASLDNVEVKSLNISDNTVNGSRHGIMISCIKNNTIFDDIKIHNNHVNANTGNAIYVDQSGTNNTSIIELNLLNNTCISNSVVIVIGQNVTICKLLKEKNNTIKTSSTTVYLQNISADKCVISENHIECTNASVGKYSSTGITNDLTFINNRVVNQTCELHTNAPLTILNSNILENTSYNANYSSGIIISQITTTGSKIAYRTAIPTSGTWAIGDRVINSNPVVGNPKSWICTVSGTPGTWTSEGNL